MIRVYTTDEPDSSKRMLVALFMSKQDPICENNKFDDYRFALGVIFDDVVQHSIFDKLTRCN